MNVDITKATFSATNEIKISASLVIPGQPITSEQGFLRGHGSYVDDTDNEEAKLVASVAGQIERVNKLISVRPIKARYIGEVGDLVVGRVAAVESKRWKVDLIGQKDAVLMLSSVNLPGGVQRIRTYEDQLQMRELYTENDLISAEVQNVASDGTLSIHTRSLKYGKLENGQLVQVPASLVPRLPQHYVSLAGGVDVLLGRNGLIWITRTIPSEWRAQEQDIDDATPLVETLQRLRQKHRETVLMRDERLLVARVRNAVVLLSRMMQAITPDSIAGVVTRCEQRQVAVKDMLSPQGLSVLISN